MSEPFGGRLFGLGEALLRKLDPEIAHGLAIRTLAIGLYPRAHASDDPRLAQQLWGLRFANPIGMAAGFDKNVEAPASLLGLGFGFVEIGTLTPEPQSGNPKPRLFRSEADRAVINRLGFNNIGEAAALRRLQGPRIGPVGVNIGANKESPDRIADYVHGIERLSAVADYFTINISSPNTPGLRDLQSPAALARLLEAVNAARARTPKKPPLLVKLAPDIEDDKLPDMLAVLKAAAVDGLIVANTTLAREGLRDAAFARQGGGLSGRPLFTRATSLLAKIHILSQGALPLIGVGGIESGETALAKFEAGASLVQLYTGFIFEGPALLDRIKQALIERLERGDVGTLPELVGIRAAEWADRAA